MQPLFLFESKYWTYFLFCVSIIAEMSDTMQNFRIGGFFDGRKSFEDNLREYEAILPTLSDDYFFIPEEDEELDLSRVGDFLYHGIASGDSLTKFEDILKNKAIMCYNSRKEKGMNTWERYDCNGPDGISLAQYSDTRYSTYDNWISPNLSFVISPSCKAIKTIYVDEDFWNWVKKGQIFNQRYSWLSGEWQVVGDIPINEIVAIGLPKLDKRNSNTPSLKQVSSLMEKHNVKLPIVDTSDRNKILLK